MATVRVSGPIFDGRADAYISEACQDAQTALGGVALAAVRAGTSAFRHSTGRYESRLDMRSGRRAAVVAAPLIYGPWLEGTGSRNRSSRFPGYHFWATAAAAVAAAARPVVEAVLAPAIDRSN
jgi:hypothetical protein